MTVRTKSELKGIFITDAIPTEQDFTDLVDTFVTKVNNIAPNAEGNITLNIPNATPVVNSLTSTVTTSALSAAQGKVLNDLFNAYKTSNDTRVTTLESKVSALEGKVVTLEGKVATLISNFNAAQIIITDLGARVTALETP